MNCNALESSAPQLGLWTAHRRSNRKAPRVPDGKSLRYSDRGGADGSGPARAGSGLRNPEYEDRSWRKPLQMPI
ncbi:hypothetical protein LAB1_29280 [Roseibium sp. LAB1]